jgi:putative membrane-bound dehydrogenase-like protein
LKQVFFQQTSLLLSLLSFILSFPVLSQTRDSLEITHPDSVYARLSDREKRFSTHALAGLKVADGLAATLFSSEPALTNPINIDVDHRGRVWVLEAYNYRPAVNGEAELGLGDRILILEDKNGDGVSDVTKIFYQGKDLNAPSGIWVMGNKAIVSQSPYVYLFTDTDGDDKADKKEVLFKGIGGTQNDAGIHAFVFGPDGKFYFSYGNAGKQLVDGKNRPLLDKFEQPINFRKYRQGVVFRCDQDFTKVEILADNFRVGWEVAVDSYGTMWQSDQEEPGHEADRVSYVMENGNFGYVDEMKGNSWRLNRTNLEDEIPRRHWHQNDPGVVPNLLETGSGFPMGMTVYEGELLPRRFWDQVLLADAGHNAVRGFPVENDGAGFKSKGIVPLIEGDKDKWFRPTDVCVAPDGSVIVSDWYDPVIGNNKMSDRGRGRIYRIAPPGVAYKIPVFNLDSPAEAVEALKSPNLSMRYMAWNACVKHGRKVEDDLENLFRKYNENPRLRARALWVLNKIEGFNYRNLDVAFRELNPNLRIVALRAVRQRNDDPTEYIKRLTTDPDPQVRRECALAIYRNHTYEALDVWLQLAKQYKGNDKWSVEALSVGAMGQWERLFPAWLAKAGPNPEKTSAGKDIIWLARTRQAIPYLTRLAADTSVSFKSRLRYFRAFDFFNAGYEKSQALLHVTTVPASDRIEVSKLALLHLDKSFVANSQQGLAVLNKLLGETYGTADYVDLVRRYEPGTENERLLKMALANAEEVLGRDAGGLLLELGGVAFVEGQLRSLNDAKKIALLASLKTVGSPESVYLLRKYALSSEASTQVRAKAALYLGSSWPGEEAVVKLLKANLLDGQVKQAAVEGVKDAIREEIKKELIPYLPEPEKPIVQEKPVEGKKVKRKRKS